MCTDQSIYGYKTICGKGSVRINVDTPHGNSNVKLCETILAPEVENNLLSVSSITRHGYTVSFFKNGAIVKRRDGTVAM